MGLWVRWGWGWNGGLGGSGGWSGKWSVRATAPDQRDTMSTPGKSPAAGTRLSSTRTREGRENKKKGVLHLRELPRRSCLQ